MSVTFRFWRSDKPGKYLGSVFFTPLGSNDDLDGSVLEGNDGTPNTNWLKKAYDKVKINYAGREHTVSVPRITAEGKQVYADSKDPDSFKATFEIKQMADACVASLWKQDATITSVTCHMDDEGEVIIDSVTHRGQGGTNGGNQQRQVKFAKNAGNFIGGASAASQQSSAPMPQEAAQDADTAANVEGTIPEDDLPY